LSEGWNHKFLAVLPNSWQILFDLDGPQFTLVADHLFNGEVVVWQLNFYNLLPLLLGWVLYNKQCLVVVRVW